MTDHDDPFDELAALFLTEPEPAADEDQGFCANNTVIELAVVGHLPVRAGVWLTPYADAIARDQGPTALLRLDSEVASLLLLRPSDEYAPAPPENTTLPEAIEQLARAADTWILRPPPNAPLQQLVEAGADRLTILSSADEAAVVAAYQLIKDLVEAAEHAGCELPAMGLAVLGADRHIAERMRQRLNRTTSTFLGIELPMTACICQMQPTIRAADFGRYTNEPLRTISVYLDLIHDAIDRAELTRQVQAEPGPPVVQVPSRPTPRAVDPAAIPRSKVAQPARIKVAPKPTIDVEPKPPSRALEPDEKGAPVPLAKYVDALTELPAVRCPGHELVELGVDKSGRIHVLAREAQLRELRIVETWAKAHRELIAMACPDHHFDPAGKIVSHVFTDTPATVSDLHASDLNLHVLTPVMVEGRQGWYAAPLNAPKR